MIHPIEPYVVNQAWGVYDPKDYSQFGFTRHNGIDLALSPDKHIIAPFNGTVVRRAFQPNGGGVFVGIISDPIAFPDFTNTTPDNVVVSFHSGTYQVLVDLLHCESIQVNEGDTVQQGQLVAIGDNTGFSTGPHCHTQWRRVLWDGKVITPVDINDANNSFDPTQFFTDKFLFETNLYFGLTSEDVRQLQLRLNVSPTGFFGSKTLGAVIHYQGSKSITPTGFVGPITRQSLNI